MWAYKVLDVAARQGKPLDVEVQVIALGDDVAWVSVPGEFFVELGMEIKKRSPFRQTIIVELANGSIGYIPTQAGVRRGQLRADDGPLRAGLGRDARRDGRRRCSTELHGGEVGPVRISERSDAMEPQRR